MRTMSCTGQTKLINAMRFTGACRGKTQVYICGQIVCVCGGGGGEWQYRLLVRAVGTLSPAVMTVSLWLKLAYFVRLYLRSEARYEIMWKSCDALM